MSPRLRAGNKRRDLSLVLFGEGAEGNSVRRGVHISTLPRPEGVNRVAETQQLALCVAHPAFFPSPPINAPTTL